MYPPSPYAHARGSFQTPVPIPGPGPDDCPRQLIAINSSWVPLILGSLDQLLLQTTWQGTPDQVVAVQGLAATLKSMIGSGDVDPACLPIIPFSGSGDCGDACEMCCLRWQNGILQQFVCGQWQDVPGMAVPGAGNQPGNGSPQPGPGGGQQAYEGCMPANSSWLLPTLVNSGDVISVESINGAWNDPDNDLLVWRCPDGSVFVAGTCVGGTSVLVGTDPLPTSPHMALIALINGTYYAIDGTGLTIPGGITNANVLLLANDSNRADDNGSICFTLNVTNNQATAWTHTFDFTLSNGGWVAATDFGGDAVYTPGTGWQMTPWPGHAGSGLLRIRSPLVAGFGLEKIEVLYSLAYDLCTANPAGAHRTLFNDFATTYGALECSLGSFDTVNSGSQSGVTEVDVEFSDANGTFTAPITVTKVIVSGLGTDPF